MRDVNSSAVDDLAVDLVVTCARFVRASARLSDQAVPTALWRAMAILEEFGAMRISDFALADRCSQPSATNMLQRLERAGHVQRVPDPADGRASLVSLTDGGRARLAELRSGLGQQLSPRLLDLPTERRDELVRAVQTIRGLLDTEEGNR